MKIAFFGAGLMGAGFIRHALDNGWQINVWNRNPARARALEADGAQAFADPLEAIEGVERIHLSLGDDASVDGVLEPIAANIPSSIWIVDHTTTAPTPTLERTTRWSDRGHVFLHAPVFMTPANCREGSGLMLLSGDPGRCEAILPDLAKMTGKVVNLGARPDAAAAFKLFGNMTIIGISGVLSDVARLAVACGVKPAEAFQLYQNFNPGAILPARAAKIADGPYEPASFTVEMARKDVRLMIEEAARQDVALSIMPAMMALYDAAVARGEAGHDTSAAFRYPVQV